MIEVGELVAFRAMAFFDRVMSKYPHAFRPSDYQIIAAACLLIASKLSANVIAPSDLANCADNSFEVEGLVEFEEYILGT